MKTFVALNADTQKEERFFKVIKPIISHGQSKEKLLSFKEKKSKEIIGNTMKMNKIKNRKTMIRDKRKDSSLKS